MRYVRQQPWAKSNGLVEINQNVYSYYIVNVNVNVCQKDVHQIFRLSRTIPSSTSSSRTSSSHTSSSSNELFVCDMFVNSHGQNRMAWLKLTKAFTVITFIFFIRG